MRISQFLCTVILFCKCDAQNHTVRFESLRNKDRETENEAWAKGTDHYVRSFGLNFEWHEVTSEDNVTLKIHHLWNPRRTGPRIPVLMLPGVLTDGDVFLMNRPEDNFAMTLANQGYEVFLANYRTSLYSSVTPEQLMYSSIDHAIHLDILPIFDLVLNVTNQQKLHLVGYSKGSTVAMGLLASKPEYNERIRTLMVICPVSYIHTPNSLLGFSMNLLKTLVYIGGNKFTDVFDTNFSIDLLKFESAPEILQFIFDEMPLMKKCFLNLLWTGRLDCITEVNFDTDLVRKLLIRGLLVRTSSRELMQFAQNSKGRAFQSFSPAWLERDVGALLFDVYPGTKKYSIDRVKCPVIILEANEEFYSQPEDYRRIRNQLCSRILRGNLSPHKYAFRVGVPNYLHEDPFVARNNGRIYVNAFYMMMREFDIALDTSLQNVLGHVDADFSHLVPQPCE